MRINAYKNHNLQQPFKVSYYDLKTLRLEQAKIHPICTFINVNLLRTVTEKWRGRGYKLYCYVEVIQK